MTKPKLYEKRPVVVEAMQWLISNSEDVEIFVGDSFINNGDEVFIITLEGTSYNLKFGDYIIKGIKGEFYPCNEDIFKKTYKQLEEE